MKRIIFVIGTLFIATPAFSQSDDGTHTPKEFFDRNYVQDSAGSGETPTPEPTSQNNLNSKHPSQPNPVQSQDTGGNLFQNGEDPAASPTISPTSTPAATPIPVVQGKGQLIEGLGVVLNGMKQDHFNARVIEMLRISKVYHIPLTIIYTIGGPVRLSLADSLRISTSGGRMLSTTEIPFGIKRAPTWIVSVAEGEILLEGLEPLEKYLAFNSRGQAVFVKPTGQS